MAAVTAHIGYEGRFRSQPPQLFPQEKVRSRSIGKDERIRTATFRNGTLHGAYLVTTASGPGLDCGRMSGFNAD